jgi:hypothetical protein
MDIKTTEKVSTTENALTQRAVEGMTQKGFNKFKLFQSPLSNIDVQLLLEFCFGNLFIQHIS